MDSPEVAEVLHAARNGHIFISRQRALICDVYKGLHMVLTQANAPAPKAPGTRYLLFRRATRTQ